ncbi:hypothetical protein BDD12DRAFT_872478 [Trichophaea hybrida]|nr:hypothetical protein BDD12DRAFT_872478 [Trichophaea hybrida]
MAAPSPIIRSGFIDEALDSGKFPINHRDASAVSQSPFTVTHDDISSDEFFRRLDNLEKSQTETATMIQERFRILRQEVEEMRKHLIEQETRKLKKSRKRFKKLRHSLVPRESMSVEPQQQLPPSSQSTGLQLSRESRRASVTQIPGPAAVIKQNEDGYESEHMPEAPLLELDDEDAIPAPVAPMAIPAAESKSSPTPSSASAKKPQRAKCSVKRGTLGSTPGSRVQSDPELTTPPKSRPGVSMAKRSKLGRGRHGGGPSRAEVAARKDDKPATFTPVNKPGAGGGKPEAQTNSSVDIIPGLSSPSDPILFSQQVIRSTLGGVKISSSSKFAPPIWKINPNVRTPFRGQWSYMVICSQSSVELPTQPMEPGAVLDLCEWEMLGELGCQNSAEFPVFVKLDEGDEYLYCGIYKFALDDWRALSVDEWEKIDEEVKDYWIHQVLTSKRGIEMLNDQNLRPPGADRKFFPKEIRGFFLDDMDEDGKHALRLSRTEIVPVRFEVNVYKTLCKTHNERRVSNSKPSSTSASKNKEPSTISDPGVAGLSVRKRRRIEDEAPDENTIQFPMKRMLGRGRRTTDLVDYNLVAMSKKGLGGSGVMNRSSEEEDEGERLIGGRR